MKVLVVKMSSMGDVIHALPAISDARRVNPSIRFHWLVEEGIQEIPAMHPAVDEVIPVAIRRWRRNWFASFQNGEIGNFVRRLKLHSYDMVVDAQGLIKSAIISLLATGPVSGFSFRAAREPLSTLMHLKSINVKKEIHAVDRQRLLFAGLLGYEVDGPADYGLQPLSKPERRNPRIMLLHGTTWESKLWPVESWRILSERILADGYEVVVPVGSREEALRAAVIAENTRASVLPVMGLRDMASTMSGCSGVVSVDTGLGHLAVALKLPLVSLYGATDPLLTGVYGENQEVIVSDHLPCIPCRKRFCRYAADDYSSKIYPPCFERTTADSVWQALQSQIGRTSPPSD